MPGTSLKIATWNVNGLRARHREIVEWAAIAQPDVLCLQELKATPDQVPEPLCTLTEYFCYWHGLKGYSGVSLHIRRELMATAPRFEHPAFDRECRIVAARLPLAAASQDVTIASVYVPNGGKDYPGKLAFLRELDAHAAEFAAGRETGWLVICGDLNVARSDMDVHPKERKPDAIGQRAEERELIERLVGRGLVDVARSLDPDNDRLFTWWAPWRNLRERNIGWRLDYVLASAPLAARARSCASLREVGTSDHGPVVAEFDVSSS
jgi:exodeoxyribonuclease-3